jgi:hypothetical protein
MASLDFMEGLQALICTVTGSRARLVPDKKGCWFAQVANAKARKLASWMWEGSTPETRGKRKYAAFKTLVGEMEQAKKQKKDHWDGVRDKVWALYIQGMLPLDIGSELGIHQKTAERWIREAKQSRVPSLSK